MPDAPEPVGLPLLPRDPASPDRIELTDIRVVGTIGVLPEERVRAQPFEVDLTVDTDMGESGRSDALDDTIDYGKLVDIVSAVISGEQPQLLERVATRIAEDVLAIRGALATTVTVRKLRPPVPHDMDASAVRVSRRRPSTRAFIALGSNLGDREEYLRRAISELQPTRVSGMYRTAPVGGPGGQDAFLNMAVEVYTHLGPFALLAECQRLEHEAGRVREVRWGPRTLDVDILFYGDETIDTETLVVPHPRLVERRFVLRPMADLAPELLPPGWDSDLPPEDIERVDIASENTRRD